MKPNIFNIPLEPPEKKPRPRMASTPQVPVLVHKYGYTANSGKTFQAWNVDNVVVVKSYNMYICAFINNSIMVFNDAAKSATTQRHVHHCTNKIGAMEIIYCNDDIAEITAEQVIEYNVEQIQLRLFGAIRSTAYPLSYVRVANSYLQSLQAACNLLNYPMPNVSWGTMLDDEKLARQYIKKQLLGDAHARAFEAYEYPRSN